MSVAAAATVVVFVALVTALVRPLGGYLARVFAREATTLDPIGLPIERWLYRVAGVDPASEDDGGRSDAFCFVAVAVAGTVMLYAILQDAERGSRGSFRSI